MVHVPSPARLPYSWVTLAVTSLTVLMAAGVTAVPAVLIHPLEVEFGWDRAAIALAVSINMLLYGLAGPFAGSLMLRFGPRRVMLTSLALMAFGVAATTRLRSLVQLYLLWGVVVGLGTGSTALVLSATVVSRWFTTHRGLTLGLLGAATSTGRLIFLPLLAAVVVALGWQAVGWVVAGCITLLVLPPVAMFMRDAPGQMGLTPFRGVSAAASADMPAPDSGPESLVPLWTALRHGDFWRLWLTFAICGATTNGLIGTHLIPHAIDLGLSEVAAAGMLALFGVVYGLDWIATVPPTAGLASDLFGKRSGPIFFGWICFGHQVGAALWEREPGARVRIGCETTSPGEPSKRGGMRGR